jgi:large subunit ribosomal protein L9
MEVILIKDVENLGPANIVVKVKNGYGRNFLIPQGLALPASQANLNAFHHRMRLQEAKEARMLDDFKAIASKLQSSKLVIKTKAGTSGKIFGSVNTLQIAQAIKDVHGIDIERRKITLPEDVKDLGSYTASIALSKQVETKVEFDVISAEVVAEG